MKVNDHIKCPHCGEDTIVKVRPVMDGWTAKGNEFYCMMCQHSLGEAADASPAPAEEKKKNTLAALFGGDIEEEKPALEINAGEKRFCRDCRFYVVHPFYNRCGKFDRETDPMGDCPEFESREK